MLLSGLAKGKRLSSKQMHSKINPTDPRNRVIKSGSLHNCNSNGQNAQEEFRPAYISSSAQPRGMNKNYSDTKAHSSKMSNQNQDSQLEKSPVRLSVNPLAVSNSFTNRSINPDTSQGSYSSYPVHPFQNPSYQRPVMHPHEMKSSQMSYLREQTINDQQNFTENDDQLQLGLANSNQNELMVKVFNYCKNLQLRIKNLEGENKNLKAAVQDLREGSSNINYNYQTNRNSDQKVVGESVYEKEQSMSSKYASSQPSFHAGSRYIQPYQSMPGSEFSEHLPSNTSTINIPSSNQMEQQINSDRVHIPSYLTSKNMSGSRERVGRLNKVEMAINSDQMRLSHRSNLNPAKVSNQPVSSQASFSHPIHTLSQDKASIYQTAGAGTRNLAATHLKPAYSCSALHSTTSTPYLTKKFSAYRSANPHAADLDAAHSSSGAMSKQPFIDVFNAAEDEDRIDSHILGHRNTCPMIGAVVGTPDRGEVVLQGGGFGNLGGAGQSGQKMKTPPRQVERSREVSSSASSLYFNYADLALPQGAGGLIDGSNLNSLSPMKDIHLANNPINEVDETLEKDNAESELSENKIRTRSCENPTSAASVVNHDQAKAFLSSFIPKKMFSSTSSATLEAANSLINKPKLYSDLFSKKLQARNDYGVSESKPLFIRTFEPAYSTTHDSQLERQTIDSDQAPELRQPNGALGTKFAKGSRNLFKDYQVASQKIDLRFIKKPLGSSIRSLYGSSQQVKEEAASRAPDNNTGIAAREPQPLTTQRVMTGSRDSSPSTHHHPLTPTFPSPPAPQTPTSNMRNDTGGSSTPPRHFNFPLR
jgi:hypothetical protein